MSPVLLMRILEGIPINFTNNFANTNYCVSGTAGIKFNDSGNGFFHFS